MAKAKQKAKTNNVKPKYKAGDKLKLKNQWAKQFDPDGLPAIIKASQVMEDGTVVYAVVVTKEMNISAKEEELG